MWCLYTIKFETTSAPNVTRLLLSTEISQSIPTESTSKGNWLEFLDELDDNELNTIETAPVIYESAGSQNGSRMNGVGQRWVGYKFMTRPIRDVMVYQTPTG